MNIGNSDFEFICELSPGRSADGLVAAYYPQASYSNTRGLPLNTYGAGPFCRFRIPTTYRNAGVYALIVGTDVMYIGECVNLSSRYNAGYGNISPRNCFKGGQETNCRINSLVYKETQAGRVVSLWFAAIQQRKELERALLSRVNPPWNLSNVSAQQGAAPDRYSAGAS